MLRINFFSVRCDYWQLKCVSDGICVDNRRRCDGSNDCDDGTDEEGCNDNPDEGDDVINNRRWWG